jgi:thioredoxin-related protein
VKRSVVFLLLASAAVWAGCNQSSDAAGDAAVAAVTLPWLTDLPQAEAQARTENKIVLMDFTGSDWCPWCIKFDNEVLDTPQFQAYASNNVVLVQLDFPEKKVLPPALKQANDALQAQFKVDGFPTLVVLDKNGKEIGRQVGYSSGGPKPFIAKLEQFKSQK